MSLKQFVFYYLAQPREEITVTMPDGSERKAKSWETSPMDVAKDVSKSLSERIVIAKVCQILRPFFKLIYTSLLFKVDGELWDLDRPLEKSCKLELLDFEHPEGKPFFF
jgi:threonyl-tRNA synthetase